MSNTSIMSIKEIIDAAFGEHDTNTVNFKHIQTILYLLARQLRVLERRVEVEIGYPLGEPSTMSLSVTEIKMHATIPKTKTKPAKSDTNRPSEFQVVASSGKSGTGKTDKTTIEGSDKAKTDKPYNITKEKSLKVAPDRSLSDKSATEFSDASSERSATDKSSDKTITKKKTTDKSDKAYPEKSTHKSSSGKSTDKHTAKLASEKQTESGEEYYKILEKIEEQRERELRVISQRSNSRVEPKVSPTPMASVDSVEVQEKLLVVERIPTDEAKSTASRQQKRSRQLSVVTQSQFEALAEIVRELQSRFQSQIGKPGFPENAQLMQELRKGASLTDAMAALQLSARLEATEQTLQQMMSLVTDLVNKTPGVEIKSETKKIHGMKGSGLEKEVIAASGASTPQPQNISHKSKAIGQQQNKSILVSTQPNLEMVSESVTHLYQTGAIDEDVTDSGKVSGIQGPKSDWITFDELNSVMEALHDDIMKAVNSIINRSKTNADTALQIANRLERKLNDTLDLGTRMDDLEALISEYTEQVNILDTGLSSQMTNYQEQLTQMQLDLETGLDNLAEALANTGGDTTAVAELNGYFTSLQLDFDNAALGQRELKENQDKLALDLKNLCNQIELLRDTKSDREEVADALRDKAGIGALNGLVSLEQFDAVRGDFEKRIGAAYDKFNNQEFVWQKAIEELLRDLNDKADWIQVMSLREDINKHINTLNGRIKDMLEIVGEPQAAAIVRKIHRDAACLSCATPAHMRLEQPDIIPALPEFVANRLPLINTEPSSKTIGSGDGDHRLCYPGHPIPHPRDPRSHICHRYCGGSHTKLSQAVNRAPACVKTENIDKAITALGSDGKSYLVDEPRIKTPCASCNRPNTKPEAPLKKGLSHNDINSNMTPSDFRPSIASNLILSRKDTSISVTPPPPIED